MSKTAFLFPGQGSQSVGMLATLAERFPVVITTFEQASEVLNYDLWKICQTGPEQKLNQTETTQPAMLAAGIASYRCWTQSGGAVPQIMAGHSLGEYSALVASGVLDFEEAIKTVALRGRLMQEATPAGVGAMAAILGLDDEILIGICEEYKGSEVVSCANFNSPGQVVIAGNISAVEQVCELASAAGARRAIMLPVSVPSHCALMKPAAEKLHATLSTLHFSDSQVPVVQNADVMAYENAAEIIDSLSRQLWQPVQWTATIEHLKTQGVDQFVECGPGKVLAGLNRRISRESAIMALTDPEAIESTLELSRQELL
ncbi:MAG: [acyl-carrier-protein] S-malonyltransferase [Rhodothermales bacterium]|jgi:[acyl-carrier-protein] S-malonyltransferase